MLKEFLKELVNELKYDRKVYDDLVELSNEINMLRNAHGSLRQEFSDMVTSLTSHIEVLETELSDLRQEIKGLEADMITEDSIEGFIESSNFETADNLKREVLMSIQDAISSIT